MAVLAAAFGLTGCSTDHFVDLNTVYAEGEPRELATNARDTTEHQCTAAMPVCVQVLTTDQAHYRKFDSPRDTEDWVSVAGADVQRTDAIVLEFLDPTLTTEEKTQLMDSVAGAHDSGH